MFCYWFAIHIEAVEEAQLLFKTDPIIESIMINLRELGKDAIAQKKDDDKRRARREQLKRA